MYFLSTLLITSLFSSSSSEMLSFTLALSPSKLVMSRAGFSGVVTTFSLTVVDTSEVLAVADNVV